MCLTIRDLTKTDEGRKWFSDEWKLCKPLNTAEDIDALFDWLQEIYGNLAMVNYPYPTDFLAALPAFPVKAFCSHLTEQDVRGKPLISALGNALNVYTNYTGKSSCMDISTTSSLGYEGWEFQVSYSKTMTKVPDYHMLVCKIWVQIMLSIQLGSSVYIYIYI